MYVCTLTHVEIMTFRSIIGSFYSREETTGLRNGKFCKNSNNSVVHNYWLINVIKNQPNI
jgi:hypothetical protein